MKKLSILFTTLAIFLGTTAWGDEEQYCYAPPTTCSTLSPSPTSCTPAKCTTAINKFNTALWGTTNSNGVQSKYVSDQYLYSSCSTSYFTCHWGPTTYYRCGPGYYGNPTSSSSICTSCGTATYNGKPLYTNTNCTTIAKRTSDAGSTVATACQMPSGPLYGYDDKGYYTYNSGTVTYTSCQPGYELTLGLCTKIIYEIEYAPHSSSPDACVLPSDLEPTSVWSLDLDPPIPLPTTVNSRGCTFGGWYTTSSGSTAVDEIDILTTFSNGKATFYGKLTANTYTIALNDNGGSGGSGTIKEVYGTKWTNSIGTTIYKLSIPTRSGYNFNGYWSAPSGGTQYTGPDDGLPSNTSFTSDTTLYAQWTQETPACIKITINDYCTSVTNTPAALYKRAGQAGWYSDSSCSTTFSGPISFSCGTNHVLRGVFSSNKGDVTGDADGDSAALLFNTNGALTTTGNSWAPTAATTIYGSWARNCSAGTGATCSRTINTTTGAVDYTTACATGYGNITNNNKYNPSCTADETEPVTGTCPAGKFYSDISESCLGCPAGYYCPGVTYTVGDGTQGMESCGYSTTRKTATCPDNAHDCYYDCYTGTSPAGSDEESDCYTCSTPCRCDEDRLYFTCNDGYLKSGDTCVAAGSITTCAAGTYYEKSASSSEPSCKTCPKGHYCPGVSQFSTVVGVFGNYPCPARKYNPTYGATSVDACIDCNGTYYTDDIFFEGAYQNGRGAPAQGYCAYCAIPYGTSNAISKTCTQIQAGTECAPGTFLQVSNNTGICIRCPVGYYCPGGVLRYKDMTERYYDVISQITVLGTGAFRCPTTPTTPPPGRFVAQSTYNPTTQTPAAITDCFIPAGYSESDDTGKWEYGQACYYTE